MVLDAGFVIHVERAVRRSFRIPASSSLLYILEMFCYTAAERPNSLRRGRARYGEAELATERPSSLRRGRTRYGEAEPATEEVGRHAVRVLQPCFAIPHSYRRSFSRGTITNDRVPGRRSTLGFAPFPIPTVVVVVVSAWFASRAAFSA